MRRILSVVLAMLMLLPSLALAEEIHLLWDIPFSQSAYKFARDAERIKGIKMETTPFPAFTFGNRTVTETAKPAEGQDLQLFGIPFDLEYSHDSWNFETGPSGTVRESVTITFPYLTSPSRYPGSFSFFPSPKSYDVDDLSAEDSFDQGMIWAQTIWKGLVDKYGTPSYVLIRYESDLSEWSDGQAAYVNEVKVLSEQEIQAMLENASVFVKKARDEYPYPGTGHHIWVNLYFGNVRSSVNYNIYGDGSFSFRNVLVYESTIDDEAPKPFLERKEQKQPYSDTGL